MRLLLTFFLFLILSFPAFAQETSENPEPVKPAETVLIDEFGPVGDCELGARIDAFFINLSEKPGSIGYILVYRGSEALPPQQSEGYLQRQFGVFRDHMKFRRYDENRIVLIDGGFRRGDSVLRQFWVVPPGGNAPEPSETVERPQTPIDKAYKVDQHYLELSDAAIQKEEEVYEEPEQTTDEISETSEEIVEPETSETETSESEPTESEPTESDEEIFDEETEEYNLISDYFAGTLNENRAARGVIFFYTDEQKYDVAKSRQIIEADLQKLAEKSRIDASRVKIVFGGYRSEGTIEFWIVPKGAAEPSPTPEQKQPPKDTESQ